jgi:hypothetical protein
MQSMKIITPCHARSVELVVRDSCGPPARASRARSREMAAAQDDALAEILETALEFRRSVVSEESWLLVAARRKLN